MSSGGEEGILRSGFVALLGWTNVGKSTLMNRLVGAKLAAVAERAQTTRHRIVGALRIQGRGQLLFVDTPGLHQPKHRMNRAMVEASRQAARDVDVAVLVLDAHRGIGAGDERVARMLRSNDNPVLAVLNKVDQVHPKDRLLPMTERVAGDWGIPTVIPLSARTGEGCAALIDELLARLPESAPLYPDDFLTDQAERQLAAEWIREKILRLTRQELPHATAVTIDSWSAEPGLARIEATVWVERDSQKKIVIGREGSLLKRVGTEARKDLEGLLECKVFLGLWVKVVAGWRDDAAALRRLGIG